MRKSLLTLVVSFVLFSFLSIDVSANSMSTLDLHVELHEDGSGTITETRQMNLDEGTEMYIVLDNLEGAVLSNYSVTDFGEPFTFQDGWDLDWSREEKAGKYGIIETDEGYELTWGIGEYGPHEYVVTYTLSDLVRQLEDGQSLNNNFFDGEGSINPEEVSITVTGPISFTQDNTRIWGFGFNGEVYLEEGDLVGWSNEPIRDNGHITLLMQFSEPIFSGLKTKQMSLEEELNRSLEDSSYGDQPMTFGEKMIIAAFVLFGILLIGFIIIVVVARSRAIKRANPLVTGKAREKLNEGQYYREIPYTKGPMRNVQYLLESVGTGSFENYFSAYVLKWVKDGYITHTTETKGMVFKKEHDQFVLNTFKLDKSVDKIERRFFKVVVEAAGADGVLDENEIKAWSKKNYKELDALKNDLLRYSKDHLHHQGYLYFEEVPFLGMHATITKASAEGEELFDRLVQFKNYLTDFSLLDERQIKEVGLWEDLIIWASLYGIAEEVAKQLAEFYPQFVSQSEVRVSDIYIAYAFSHSMQSGYSSAVSAASGGGGSTSFGGGGGSMGGGGSGAR
ncbi:hypothetical protein HMI01_00540 [Halolactibacillus miurensis]|uniref:Predicted membrane protein n=1 Tax=Halolactibacillus miurensis TaxID=306541 RepID=A0A1I6P7R8_9BACI|nr:DUF2207 domain-containing protein [Halolactibacillus miurensis]GEM03066.1 hypothetical protein HMI01_00540 [Halolactibacillus miurensis]SFS36206.1 Predicted membrane protein [Halolactibacillus miurensis]